MYKTVIKTKGPQIHCIPIITKLFVIVICTPCVVVCMYLVRLVVINTSRAHEGYDVFTRFLFFWRGGGGGRSYGNFIKVKL